MFENRRFLHLGNWKYYDGMGGSFYMIFPDDVKDFDNWRKIVESANPYHLITLIWHYHFEDVSVEMWGQGFVTKLKQNVELIDEISKKYFDNVLPELNNFFLQLEEDDGSLNLEYNEDDLSISQSLFILSSQYEEFIMDMKRIGEIFE